MRRAIAVAFFGALVALVAIGLGEELRSRIDIVDAWLSTLGPRAMLVYVVLLVVGTAIFIPESMFAILGGAIFGLKWGFALALIGNVLAAGAQYYLARHFLHRIGTWLTRKNPMLARLRSVFEKGNFRLQALVRLTPLNPAAINYLFGVSGARFPAFIAASPVCFPHVFTEVYIGYASKHVIRRAGGGVSGSLLHDVLILGGLVATAGVLVVISRTALREINRTDAT